MKQQRLNRTVVHARPNAFSWPVLKKVDTFKEETFAEDVDPQNYVSQKNAFWDARKN